MTEVFSLVRKKNNTSQGNTGKTPTLLPSAFHDSDGEDNNRLKNVS